MMKLSKLFETLYEKYFIAIVYTKEHAFVHVDTYKKKRLVQSGSKEFELSTAKDEIANYIAILNEQSPFCYVVMLNSANNQGGLSSCDMSVLNAQVGTLDVKTICISKRWMLYTSKEELNTQMTLHKPYGLDYIFSPFYLIKSYFDDKMEDKKMLFILLQDESISVSVFQNASLVYAKHIDLNDTTVIDNENEGSEDSLEFDMGTQESDEDDSLAIELDDIDALDDLDELDELSDLSDIEDLDTLEELEEFSEESEIVTPQKSEEATSNTNIDSFDEEYIKYTILKESIESYYRDERFEKEFIEDIYIANATASGEDLKRYLEEELFLHVVLRSIDIAKEVALLAFKEPSNV